MARCWRAPPGRRGRAWATWASSPRSSRTCSGTSRSRGWRRPRWRCSPTCSRCSPRWPRWRCSTSPSTGSWWWAARWCFWACGSLSGRRRGRGALSRLLLRRRRRLGGLRGRRRGGLHLRRLRHRLFEHLLLVALRRLVRGGLEVRGLRRRALADGRKVVVHGRGGRLVRRRGVALPVRLGLARVPLGHVARQADHLRLLAVRQALGHLGAGGLGHPVVQRAALLARPLGLLAGDVGREGLVVVPGEGGE